MTNVLKKSMHPVEVKKIKIEIWTLRSEIEAAISKRMLETETSDIKSIDISDIQNFYQNHISLKTEQETDEEVTKNEAETNVEQSSDDHEDNDETAENKAIENETNPDVAKLAEDVLNEVEVTEAQTETLQKPFTRIRPEDSKIFIGETLLADVQMDQAMFFINNNFVGGQNVVIRFLVTNPFLVTGEVVKTLNISRNSKIIKEKKLDHRLQVKFSLLFENERSQLRDFLRSVEPTINTPPKKVKKKTDEDENDDFDDLGL